MTVWPRARRGALRRRLAAPLALHALRFVWVVAVVWYELGAFVWSVSGCRWPDTALRTPGGARPTHVLLVADPQVLDAQSYPGRAPVLARLTQLVVDLNLRKSWAAALRFRPDAVVFLGDMMDNGRLAVSDNEYKQYYNRFKNIFALPPSIETFYIPGNHDVGLGKPRAFSPRARARFTEHFGPPNRRAALGGHTLALLDAPALVEEDYARASAGVAFPQWPAPRAGAVEFTRHFAAEGSDEPVILFSHVPLFRPDTAPCGPLRERGTIRRGVGFGYQNTLGKDTTHYLLQQIQPALIFSGDDHDYCEYTHSVPRTDPAAEPTTAKEVTVKSFSMAMGIRHPGFQLLSLAPRTPGHAARAADAPCVLPDQLAIYTHRYLPLFLLTLLALLVRRAGARTGSARVAWPPPPTPRPNAHPALPAWPGSPGSPSLPASPLPPPLPPSARTLRTPLPGGAGTPSLRASRPATPLDSPLLLAPLLLPPADDDDGDGDAMDPVQYAHARRGTGTGTGFGGGGGGGGGEAHAFFLPPPGGRPLREKRRWAWSRTFVCRGRRRRVTLRAPAALGALLAGLASLSVRGAAHDGAHARGHGLLRLLLADVLAVAWPPALVFVAIAVWLFQ